MNTRNYIYEIRTINPFDGTITSNTYRAPSYDEAVKAVRREIDADRSLRQILAPVETSTAARPERTATQKADHRAVKRAVYARYNEVAATPIINELNEIFDWSHEFNGSYIALVKQGNILHAVNCRYPRLIP